MRHEISHLLLECMRFAKRQSAQITVCGSRGVIHVAGKRFPRPTVSEDGTEQQDPRIVSELIDAIEASVADRPQRIQFDYEDGIGRRWFNVRKTPLSPQYYGGVMGPGFYMPYTFSGYTPGYYGGFGVW